ncbi:MAG: hypothetical protein ACRDJC_00255 [Thermomicrobiales bacterium]
MAEQSTFIAPGQRYVRPGHRMWRIEDQLTILHVGMNPCGHLWVTYRALDGEEGADLASRLEEAVVAGELIPVADCGPIAQC